MIKANKLLACLGAILGALIGAILYYFVIRLGFVVTLSSLGGILLSLILYNIFAKRLSVFGIVFSIVLNIVAVFLADSYIIAEHFTNSNLNLLMGYDLPHVMWLSLEELFRGDIWIAYKYALMSAGFIILGGIAIGSSIMHDQRLHEQENLAMLSQTEETKE